MRSVTPWEAVRGPGRGNTAGGRRRESGRSEETDVALIRGLVKAAVVKRLYDEARKPQNQRRAKELFHKVTGKGGSGGHGRADRPR